MIFSIITPTYNSEKYLEETILSVISQKGDFEIEYILIDGNSNDNTCNIINEYKKRIECGHQKIYCNKITIKLISESDSGMYDALSKAFKIVNGDWIGYINSDDFYFPNSFRAINLIDHDYKQVSWVTSKNSWYNKYGFVCGSQLQLSYDRKFIAKGIYGNELPCIQQESTFWKRELLDKVELKKIASLKLAGDFYLWFIFSKDYELYTLNTHLSGFRMHKNNKSSDLFAYRSEMNKITGKRHISFFDKFKIKLNIFAVKYLSEDIIFKLSKRSFNFWNSDLGSGSKSKLNDV